LGFDWDAYKGGGNYITAAEKKVLADNGIPFTITAIRQVHKFDNENYELTVMVPDPETGEPEERVLSFPIGTGAESRDRTIAGMVRHLEESGESIDAKVEKIGRGYFLTAA
jgi:hypothetical protein